MKSSFCIDLQRFMLIPTKFPLILILLTIRCIAYAYLNIILTQKYKKMQIVLQE